MMFNELERKEDYPLNSGNMLCLWENHKRIAMSLQRFKFKLLRANIKIEYIRYHMYI